MQIKTIKKLAVAGLLLGGAAAVYAGGAATGGSEFSEIWDLIEGWSQGFLGRILALGALIVGIAFGLVRQSVIAAVVGIAMAIVLQYGPTVIEGIVTSTAEGAQPAQVVVMDNAMQAQDLPQIDLAK